MSFSESVYVNWIMMLSFTIAALATAIFLGWYRKLNLVQWRGVKLSSSIFGSVGIVILLSNFEIATRQTFFDEGNGERILEFIEAKSDILLYFTLLCRTSEEACRDVRHINDVVNYINIRDKRQIHEVINWRADPQMEDFIKQINFRIGDMDRYVSPGSAVKLMLAGAQRVGALFFAELLVIFAVAGAVGEATFQLREAISLKE